MGVAPEVGQDLGGAGEQGQSIMPIVTEKRSLSTTRIILWAGKKSLHTEDTRLTALRIFELSPKLINFVLCRSGCVSIERSMLVL
jgi:hypothetical protein